MERIFPLSHQWEKSIMTGVKHVNVTARIEKIPAIVNIFKSVDTAYFKPRIVNAIAFQNCNLSVCPKYYVAIIIIITKLITDQSFATKILHH